jgi:hypothetical protein
MLYLLFVPAYGAEQTPQQSTPLPPSFSYPATDSMTVKELFAVMNERDRAINQRFELQDKAVNAALAAAKEAVTAALVAAKEAVAKAEFAAEKRFDAVNEFRNTLRDQQQTLISKGEAEIRFKSIDEKIQILITRQQQDLGRTEGTQQLWGLIVGAGGIIIALGAIAANYKRKGTP